MDPHDRRLSVCKSSSSKISKPSSALRPPSAASSRLPPTVVSADLTNFRHVVQQLTGTPPPSASSSPVHDSPRSSRLQRIAPPRLRSVLQPLHQSGQHHPQYMPDLPLLQQSHHPYMRRDARAQDNEQPLQPDFSWLSSVELFSPPLPSTQVSNLNQNPDSSLNGCINPSPHPNPNPLLLSPHLFSARSPNESLWVSRFIRATPSPRPLSNSAGSLHTLLPLPSVGGEDLETGSGQGQSKAFEWSASNAASSNGSPLLLPLPNGRTLLSSAHPMLLPSPNGHPLLPFSSNGAQPLLGSSSHGIPQHSSSLSSFSIEQSAHGPWTKGHSVLPSPPPTLHPLLPLSPSTTCFNHWLPPWPPSPFLPLPLAFSPGLYPPSPGFAPFISSPGGFSVYGTNDLQSKLP